MADESNLPWWKRSLLVAVLGAAIPVATFVQGSLQKERELTLQERNQLQQFRAQYMSVLAEAGVEGIEVLSDFIADTEPNKEIRDWATKQRDKAKKEIEALDQRIQEEQKNAAAAEDKAEEAAEERKRSEERLRRLMAQAQQDKAAKEAALRERDEARKAAVKADANAAASRAKLIRTEDALKGVRKVPLRTIVTKEGTKVTVRDHRNGAAQAE
jgi:phage-related minor tail protein